MGGADKLHTGAGGISQIARLPPWSAKACLLAVFLALSTAPVWADFDVNAVAGTVTIDGLPAPGGTQVQVQDVTVGHSATTAVDGPNVPPFLRGQGKFDTGDLPQFSTGDMVVVSILDPTIGGEATAILVAGTTTVNLNARRFQPPSIGSIPAQFGQEDVPWQLDLDPYLSDPDTPLPSLGIAVSSPYVTVQGHVLGFLYPEGVLQDLLTVYVQDSTFTVQGQIQVFITPVNDPPRILKIPDIALTEGASATIDLSRYVLDPDDPLEKLVMQVSGGTMVVGSIEGTLLTVSAWPSQHGNDSLLLVVSDPGGLFDSQSIRVEISVNLTALVESYQRQIEALNSEVSELTRQNLNLSGQVSELLNQVSSLEGVRQRLEQDLKEARDTAGQLLKQLEEMQAQSALDARALADLESEKLNLSTQVESLRQSLDSAISSYEAAISRLSSVKGAYEAELALCRSRIAEMEAALFQIESNSTQQRELIANLTTQKADLESLAAARAQEISRLQELVEELEARATRLEQEKAATEATIAEVNRSVDELRRKNLELVAQLDELTNRAPAHLVQGNETGNLTEPGLVESLLAKATRLAGGGLGLVLRGIRSRLVILAVAIIIFASAVSIVARTSWVRLASRGGTDRGTRGSWPTTQAKTKVSLSASSGSPASTAPTQVMIKRKPSRPAVKRVIVSTRPVSLGSIGAAPASGAIGRRVTRPLPGKFQEESSGHEDANGNTPPVGAFAPPGTSVAQASATRGTGEVRRPVDSTDKSHRHTQEARIDLGRDCSGLSEADREYIETLLKLGFTKEAQEELRKLPKGGRVGI